MLTFKGMSSQTAQSLWDGGTDDHGNLPERARSDGLGNPCRHCLKMIDEGEEFLILSHKPFVSRQPYAEQGPIFLHAEPCAAYHHRDDRSDTLPPVLNDSPQYMLRGYDGDERIVYGSGSVVATASISSYAQDLLDQPNIEFVHVRTASNNCWQARIERQDDTSSNIGT